MSTTARIVEQIWTNF